MPAFLNPMIEWLATPMSGAGSHVISADIAWHGRWMVLAWAVLVPASILIARFFKVTPGQDWPRVVGNSFWILNHRRLGYASALITVVSIGWLIVSHGFVSPLANWHASAGWLTALCLVLLIVGTLLRGSHGGPVHPMTKTPMPREQWFGDHYNMTARRIVFEYTHKFGAYGLAAIAFVAVFSGLWRADAPRWMWVLLALWLIALAVFSAILQAKGKCLDTYQAIWGPSSELPGSQRAPIGWGIRRIKSE